MVDTQNFLEWVGSLSKANNLFLSMICSSLISIHMTHPLCCYKGSKKTWLPVKWKFIHLIFLSLCYSIRHNKFKISTLKMILRSDQYKVHNFLFHLIVEIWKILFQIEWRIPFGLWGFAILINPIWGSEY